MEKRNACVCALVALCLAACAGSADAPPPDVGSHRDATGDSGAHDADAFAADSDGDAAPAETSTSDDDASTTPDASDAGDASDGGDAADSGATPPWLDPDAHWDAPRTETWIDDATGCTKLWEVTRASGAPSYTFGAGGVTIGDLSLRQGDLVGDFDLTFELGKYTRTASGYALLEIGFSPDGTVQAGAGYPGFDRSQLGVAYDDLAIEISGYDAAGVSFDELKWTDSTSATLHVVRSGIALTATLTTASGASVTHTAATFGSGPLRMRVDQGSGATATLRRLTVVGGGGGVRSDDFSCDSFE